MFTCSLSCITSLLSLFTRAAPSSTVETLWANFNVLTVSPKESTSGLTCANINVLARPPEIQFFHKENLVNIRLISNVFKEMSTHKNKIFKHCKVTNHFWLPHSLQRSFQHKWINKRVKNLQMCIQSFSPFWIHTIPPHPNRCSKSKGQVTNYTLF